MNKSATFENMNTASLRLLAFILIVFSVGAERVLGEKPAPADLQKTGEQAYKALRRHDWDVLLSMRSHDRFFRIALRRAVWTRMEANDKGKTLNQAFPHLLDDLSTYGWEERDMEFDTTDPDQIAKLKKALTRVAHETDNTIPGVGVAINGRDDWDERELGPNASGKVASDEFWYLYFRKEGNKWKIWKLELAVH